MVSRFIFWFIIICLNEQTTHGHILGKSLSLLIKNLASHCGHFGFYFSHSASFWDSFVCYCNNLSSLGHFGFYFSHSASLWDYLVCYCNNLASLCHFASVDILHLLLIALLTSEVILHHLCDNLARHCRHSASLTPSALMSTETNRPFDFSFTLLSVNINTSLEKSIETH